MNYYSELDDISLMYGLSGYVLFLFEYASATQNQNYANKANHFLNILLDQIQRKK